MLDCGCKLLMYVNTDHCHKYIFCSWSCSNDQGILKDSPLPPGTDSVNAPPSTKLWGRGNYILKEELIGGTAITFLSITDAHACIYLQADRHYDCCLAIVYTQKSSLQTQVTYVIAENGMQCFVDYEQPVT